MIPNPKSKIQNPKPEQAGRLIELKARCEAQMDLSVCNSCTCCSLRCSEGVQASTEEWDALQAHLRAASPEARAYIAAVEAQDKAVDLGDEVTVQMCRYLDMRTKMCVIYPVRPLVCRLLGHVEWLPCPIDKVPRTVPMHHALELMRAYSDCERKTFAEWQAAQSPPHGVMGEI